MALTVEELQIVLSCDATTAQAVLDKMEATVKAYTDKFQKYFNNMGGKKNISVPALDTVVKDVEKQTKKLAKAGADWKKQYEKTFGETYEESAAKMYRNTGEYKPSGKRYIESESWARHERGNATNGVRLVNQGAGAGPQPMVSQWLDKAKAEMSGFSRAVMEKLGPLKTQLGEAFQSIGPKIGSALSSAGGIARNVFQDITVWGRISAGSVKGLFTVLKGIGTVLGTVGKGIKKAFQGSLLGKFVKRLGSVMMRMAAMKLIRGTLDGIKQGLEMLGKAGGTAGKAMNQVKAAGQSVKAALGVALMPVVKALAPVFYQVAQAVTAAGNAIARFLATLLGQSSYTAAAISSSMDDVSSSYGGAGKAAKGALADFDEINLITKSSGGGGGGGAGGDTGLSTISEELVGSGNGFAEQLREAFLGGDWSGLGSLLSGKLGELSRKFTDWVNGLKNLNIGTKIAAFFNGIFSDSSTWGDVGAAAAAVINFIESVIADFLKNFDVTSAAESVATLFNTLLTSVNWTGLGSDLGLFLLDVVEFCGKFLLGLDWAKIFKGIFDIVVQAVVEILSNPQRLVRALKDLVLGLVDLLGGLVVGAVASIFDGIGLDGLANKITTKWDSTMDALDRSLDGAIDNMNTSWGNAGKSAEDAGQQAYDAFDSARSQLEASSTAAAGLTQNVKGASDELLKLDGTDVTVGVDAEVDTTVETNDLFSDRPISHGKKIGEGSAKIDVGLDSKIDKTVDSTDVFSNKAGVIHSPTGMVIGLGMRPEVQGPIKSTDLLANSSGVAQDNSGLGITFKVKPEVEGGASTIQSLKDVITGVNEISNKKKTANLAIKMSGAKESAVTKMSNAVSKFFDGSKTSTITINQGGASLTQIQNAADAIKNFPKSVTVQASIDVVNAAALKKALQDALTASAKITVNGKNAGSFKVNANNVQTMASGGIAYGITNAIIGEYAGASSNPEVVAPLSKLQGILESSGTVSKDTMTRDQANTMIQLLQRIERKEIEVKPSVGLGQVVQQSLGAYART